MAESFLLTRLHATEGSNTPDLISLRVDGKRSWRYRTDTGTGGLKTPLRRYQLRSELMLIPVDARTYSLEHLAIPPERWFLSRPVHSLHHLPDIEVAQTTNYYLGDFLNSPDGLIHQHAGETVKQACEQFHDELQDKPLVLPFATGGAVIIDSPCEEATLNDFSRKLRQ